MMIYLFGKVLICFYYFLVYWLLVQMVTQGRDKMDYLTDTNKNQNEDDPTFQTWDTKNSIVMSWLIHSMDNNISKKFLL